MRRSESGFYRREPVTREGIYIGYRTVNDGTSEWIGSEEGCVYTAYQSYRVAVVVLGERENPVYVFPSDVRQAGEDS